MQRDGEAQVARAEIHFLFVDEEKHARARIKLVNFSILSFFCARVSGRACVRSAVYFFHRRVGGDIIF